MKVTSIQPLLRKICHLIFNWHFPDFMDQITKEYQCMVCGKEIDRGDNGNWILVIYRCGDCGWSGNSLVKSKVDDDFYVCPKCEGRNYSKVEIE